MGDDEEFLRGLADAGRVTRRTLLRFGIGAAAAAALSPFLAGLQRHLALAAQPPTSGKAISLNALLAAAKKEKELNVIALPRDWANYGEMLDTFTKKYGLKINSASPNASSAEELQAIRSLKGQRRAPDVVDVGPSFAIQGAQEKLFTPYKHSFWDTIPASMKNPDGLWVGDYFGVIALGVNTDIQKTVPQAIADLKKPTYKSQVALNGDPRRSGSAFAGVWAAALANGGSLDDIAPGIEFFAELKKLGNFIPVDATPATVASGQTPVTFDWDYLQIGYNKEFKGKVTWRVQVPKDGVFGNFFAQAISASAPHPFAARLWQEFIYSDEGQVIWLKGFAHPARFDDMVKRGVIPQNLLAALPAAEPYKTVRFPTVDQTKKAQKLVADQWASKVAGK
ncbi:MAG: ABC transporter substrate-binding protein [Armatimonadetes bacterium]|nr:ABC transporter substrate-binding protein [Armatimonadota bacterium]